MSRGIYILANDRVLDNTIALLNSIRLYDANTPIVMIPYNRQYQTLAKVINKSYGVQIYEDLQIIEDISNLCNQICGSSFFERPNLLRKFACWFGQFDEFLYIDTDIVVFERIIENLKYLNEYDFICCDYQHLAGVEQVFTPKIREIFSDSQLNNVFNVGFFCSNKNLLSQEDLSNTFKFCAKYPDFFYLKNSEQTLMNYLMLKKNIAIFNIANQPSKEPGNWAGSPNFKEQNKILIDSNINKPLKFLHWAGIQIEPGCPYWDIWEHYRYLNTSKPEQLPPNKTKKTLWQKIKQKIKSLLSIYQ